MRIVLASGNPHKIEEIRRVLPGAMALVTQTELGIPSPEETGQSFIENALLKARHAAQLSGLPAIADDSGLTVDAIDGAPGIYSARYAGPDATDADNNARLLEALRGIPLAQRTAQFHCVIVMLKHAQDPVPLVAEGHWQGLIALSAEGESGFGYDPLFFLPSARCTVAQLTAAEKDRMSHRGQALAQLQLRLQP